MNANGHIAADRLSEPRWYLAATVSPECITKKWTKNERKMALRFSQWMSEVRTYL
jgi:hypothetical protein